MASQKGFTLIEMIVAVSILALIGGVFLAALSTSSKALITADERETAKNIAELEMEYVKASSFSWANYPEFQDMTNDYPGYSAEAVPSLIDSRDANIQRITVTVRHNGRMVFSIVCYKEKRKS